jgi:uncharacterized protein (AIM24 family)
MQVDIRNRPSFANLRVELQPGDKIIAEASAEIAKVQPQIEPMRTKVKQMNDQYLTMLPK